MATRNLDPKDRALLQPLSIRRLTISLLVACAVSIAPAATAGGATAPGTSPGGTNLVRNGDGSAGDVSVQGWDAITIPGWRVLGGLPTVVRYGTPGFPQRRGGRARPGGRAGPGERLFAGGAGGSARLEQVVALRAPGGSLLGGGSRYRLSAALGGGVTSAGSVTARFLSAAGKPLGEVRIGPVGELRQPSLADRTASGRLPHGAASAEIVIGLATSLRNFDGPDAPKVGYDRAVAGHVGFTVSAAVSRAPVLAPPAARVPRFEHVFMFMFENQDFHSVIGNRKQAPYLNSLLRRGSLLANLFAEEHPSDGNYLALSAGGVFGLPLTDPLEINPRFSVEQRNIGDLVSSAHESWRAYMQSADGPCDDTVHRYYWNDDLPFLYFPDVRDRPAYCAAHVVPLQAINHDLASAATTPSFSWIGPNDCSDMEGCGIHQGDRFLATELGKIRRSPAWRTQRSLAIITFDEDAYDHQHPAQLVPTIVLGSRDVRAGFVSHVRYTHYSLLRTVEAALHLGTLTRNDRYASAVNDVFDPPALAHIAHPASARGTGARRAATALVANSASATVTPVSLATGKPGKAIPVGADPAAIAVSGHTAYVVDRGAGAVTPIDTVTRRPGRPIRVGADPVAIAIARSGRTAYVVNGGSNTVTPIDTATKRPGHPIRVGSEPRAISVTPDGRSAYVLDWGGASVTPIDLATDRPEPPIHVGTYPYAIAIARHGRVAYVANFGSNTVTPIDTADGRAKRPIAVGQAPNALAVTPDGAKVEVVSGDRDLVTPIDAASLRLGSAVAVGRSPDAVAISPDGPTAWVVNTLSGTLTPIATRTGHAGHPVSVGLYSYPTAITLADGGRTAVVVDTYAGKVTLVDTRTRRVFHSAKTGSYPVAAAIAK